MQNKQEMKGGRALNIAVCDDQIEELEAIEALLRAWQEQQRAVFRLHLFHSAGELLDAGSASRCIFWT